MNIAELGQNQSAGLQPGLFDGSGSRFRNAFEGSFSRRNAIDRAVGIDRATGSDAAWIRFAAKPLRSAGMSLVNLVERSRQRRRLVSLDDRLLNDLGISRADAVGEYRKPFWRA